MTHDQEMLLAKLALFVAWSVVWFLIGRSWCEQRKNESDDQRE